MKLKHEFVIQELAGKYVAITTKSAAKGGFNGMLKVNEVGKFILEAMKNDVSQPELIDLVKKYYGVEDMDVEKEIDGFINKLRDADLLIE